MSQVLVEVTTESLQAFADAWNRHDVAALMSFMTDDCVFETSAGPEVWGTRCEGREAVRAAFAEVWATFPDAHWGNARHFVCGDRGVSEWTFTGTRRDGTRDCAFMGRGPCGVLHARSRLPVGSRPGGHCRRNGAVRFD